MNQNATPQPRCKSGWLVALRGLLLDVLLWLRSNETVRAIYGAVPISVRRPLSQLAWRQFSARVMFPRLPLPVAGQPSGLSAMPGDGRRHVRPINMYGFFGGQFGLGECARLYACALEAAGTPVAAIDVDLHLSHEWRPFEHPAAERSFFPDGIDLVVINPDFLQRGLEALHAHTGNRRPRAGVWFWELDEVPESWHWAVQEVDAVVVASSFVEQAFRKITPKPVRRIPIPLCDLPDSGLQRADFGLQDDCFVFLCTFDFHSSIHRKNPWSVIRAFRAAFPSGRKDVRLLVKSINGVLYSDIFSRMVQFAEHDPRIIFRDEVIHASHLGALQRVCDAYVSLHRAEGFGLGMAECMARGKPVVATAWSGNMEFMTPETACLVDYHLTPVQEGAYPASREARWAEADWQAAAAEMRRLVDDEAYRIGWGTRGAAHVRRVLEPGQIALKINALADELASGALSSRPDR